MFARVSRFVMVLGFLALVAGLQDPARAEAGRVALVIGQSAYPGGASAVIGLPPLPNPKQDAARVAALLGKHGFEVLSCDGTAPGCFNLDRARLHEALGRLESKAKGADMALVYFAGHGLATAEGNILTPTDAKVACETGAITQGITVERVLAATAPARHKLLILDACRDNPLGAVCPSLAGKQLSFTRIEAGAMQGLLLVTSTQFGQQALDGKKGTSSPFLGSLIAALEGNPNVYFEQVMNEVARATYEAAGKVRAGFMQIPGKVVGGAAPQDCLAGRDCIGDARMAALSKEVESLTADASGVRNLLSAEEEARGKPYTPEERGKRVAELSATLASIGGSSDPLRQEAKRLIDAGNVTGGEAKLDAALDADEKAILEAEKVAEAKRKTAAKSARDLAVLARGRDVAKAVAYYQRAVKFDPGDAQTWQDLGTIAMDAGLLDEAQRAFAEGMVVAEKAGNAVERYWSALGLGDVMRAQGDLAAARQHYDGGRGIADDALKADPGNAGWQRDLSVSYDRVGDVQVAQGNLPEALKSFRDSLAIADRFASSDPGNAGWQRDLSVSQEKVGDVLVAQGNLPEALKSFRESLAIRDRLAKSDPGNAGWQRDLSVSFSKVGDILVAQGNLPEALKSFRDSLELRDRLASSDPGNAGWQRDLSVSYARLADVQRRAGDAAAAATHLSAGRAIIARLVAENPDWAEWKRDLAWFDAEIAALEGKAP